MKVWLLLFTLFFSPLLAEDGAKIAVVDLSKSDKKIYSQNGEDGVIVTLFSLIGTQSKYYVEFGVEGGIECNTRYLRENLGWRGLWMDAGNDNPEINLHKEFITAENINELFEKYHVPEEFDLLSIDIDFNDFYVWKTLNSKYRPRVVCIEYNAAFLPSEDKVVPYNPTYQWHGGSYFGASILAYARLAKQKGYSLVYAEDRGVNLFFVRDDILCGRDFSFLNVNDVDKIYRPAKYDASPKEDRPYVSSAELLSK